MPAFTPVLNPVCPFVFEFGSEGLVFAGVDASAEAPLVVAWAGVGLLVEDVRWADELPVESAEEVELDV